MKLVFSFLLCLLSISCNQSSQEKTKFDDEGLIFITKTNVCFNIYSNTQELFLEYTKQNCDSSTLKILNDIWFTSMEFYNQQSPKENKTTSQSITLIRDL